MIKNIKLKKIVMSKPKKFSFSFSDFWTFGGIVPIYKSEVSRDTKTVEITGEGVVVTDKKGSLSKLHADTVMITVSLEPEKRLLEDLKSTISEVYAIGDCIAPRRAIGAICEGFEVARMI